MIVVYEYGYPIQYVSDMWIHIFLKENLLKWCIRVSVSDEYRIWICHPPLEYPCNIGGLLVNELENGYFSLYGIKLYAFERRNCTKISFQTLRVKLVRK